MFFQFGQTFSNMYYEESLVSSNLNSNLLKFHCAHPNVGTVRARLEYFLTHFSVWFLIKSCFKLKVGYNGVLTVFRSLGY